MNTKHYALLVATLSLGSLLAGCQPQTPTEKAQDKVEDAAHETKQGMERAGDKVKDATN